MQEANPNPWALSEEQAVLVDEVEATMSPNHDRLVIRKWDGLEITTLTMAAQDLRQRTSMSNEPGVDKNYVMDPQAGTKGPMATSKTFPGRWRGVSVRHEMREGQGIITQTLAYGLVVSAEDLPTAELVQTIDRLIVPHAITGDPEIEQREVRYRGIDPSYVETLKDTIALTAGVVEARSVRMQDGTYNIHALQETPTWAAFAVAAPDTTSKFNYSTKHEGLRETWHSIANDDALANVYVTNTTGYRINDVTVEDRLDGSVLVTRIQVAINRWWTVLINASDADALGAYAVNFNKGGVLDGFKEYQYIAEGVPIDDGPNLVAALLEGSAVKAWAGSTAYVVNDMRSNGGLTYICLVAHTSTGTFADDIGSGKWNRIKDAHWRNTGQGVCDVIFAVEPACEYGYVTDETATTGGQRASSTYTWFGVDPVRMTAVWALAGAYNASGTLTYKRRSRTYDRFGVAVVEATAWSPSSTGSSNYGIWVSKLDQLRHRIVTRQSEWHDKDDWAYFSERYDIKFKYAEDDAWNDITGGLQGSTVTPVAPNVWRSLKVTAAVQSAWHVGPVNTTVETPPAQPPAQH